LHAYTGNGRYDGTAGFDLHTDNGDPSGIVGVVGLFYVVDWDDGHAAIPAIPLS